ncbi:thioesterase II family protein [Erwinia psidii]|uniref:Thioesterase n=1 Tax=Erwinia psidii TaxID=69224 RepID=A0A3N6UKL4_9GAMM|nr:alpha/beta fold hydrolase [Erwinia psidii]MCX8959519.1 thioesterase [Erwinia psidii]RQM36479.1 thioesterase [Erwinia psidii]
MDKLLAGQTVGECSVGLHLVLCPFAGGSASAFQGWRDSMPGGIEVSLAVYPGRDRRMKEPCVNSINALAKDLLEQRSFNSIAPQRLVIAGHSMGAQVAFEVCRQLEHRNIFPRGLVLSGCHAPHLTGRKPIGHLADHEFIAGLVAMGGCSQTLTDEPALWPIFMPMLRADFTATEQYRHASLPSAADRLKTPTLLVCGSADPEASPAEVADWKAWLNNPLGPVSVSGDHFYITRRPAAFLEHIRRCFDRSDSYAFR